MNQRTRHLSILSLLELIENSPQFGAHHRTGLSHTTVNLGAGDGVCRSGHDLDPANCLLATGYGGVVFEASEAQWPPLTAELGRRRPDVQLVLEAAEPATVSERLAEALARRPGPPVPRGEVDLIKVDVDGADCELAAALAAGGWRPKVWHVEVNPLFPPGLAFRSRRAGSAPGFSGLGSAFSHRAAAGTSAAGADVEAEAEGRKVLGGCSLQVLLGILQPAYAFLQLEFENAVFVRRDVSGALEPWISAHSAMTKWRAGYFCHPLARVRHPHDRDRDSLFLQYDFRMWGDPALDHEQLHSKVQEFLRHFIVPGSFDFGDVAGSPAVKADEPPLTADQAEMVTGAMNVQPLTQRIPDDPNCLEPWKGQAFQWPTILGNTERLLALWAGGGGDVAAYLRAFAEDLARVFAIDRGWPIFKVVARAECPLGGIAVAAVLRWRCAGGAWEADAGSPATARLFLAMRSPLPLLLPGPAPAPGRPTGLDCENMLERYLETALRRLDLAAALGSRWPVFELLSAHHALNRAWPRGYP